MSALEFVRKGVRGAARALRATHQAARAGVTAFLRNPLGVGARLVLSLIRDDGLSRAYGGDPIKGRATSIAGIAICTALAWVGFNVGADQYLAYVDAAQFYQPLFGPAVSLACTGQLDQVHMHPALHAFLIQGVPLEQGCNSVVLNSTSGWNAVDFSTLYLYVLAAISWNLFGFDWQSLFFTAGLLTSILAVGAYLLMRCFTSSRLLAASLALLILFSNPVLEHIPHLRDFSKAPLIFMALGIVGRIATRSMNLREVLLWAGAAGLVIGLGKGFRSDVILVLPVALLTFVLITPHALGLKLRLARAGMSAAALFIGYLIAGAPADMVNAGKPFAGTGIGHVFILGFAEQFYGALGMHQADHSVLRAYKDENVNGLVSLYHYGHGGEMVSILSSAYETISRQLLLDIVLTTPADIYQRIFATANALGGFALNYFIYGPVLVLILVIAGLTYWRSAAFFVISALIIVPILSLQFSTRHSFFAVFLGAAALGIAATIVVELIVDLVIRARQRRWRGQSALPAFRRVPRRAIWVGAIGAGAVAAGVAGAFLTDSMQRRALEHQLATYEALQWHSVPIVHDGRRVITDLDSPEFQEFAAGRARGETNYGFLRVEVAVDPVASNPSGLIETPWTPAQPGAAVEERGRRFRSGGQLGYQFSSRTIEASELDRTSDGEPYIDIDIRAQGNGGWGIGLQDAGGAQWLGYETLPVGEFRRRLRFAAPADQTQLRLVIEASLPNIQPLEIERFDIISGFTESCNTDYYSILTDYSQAVGSSVIPSPQMVNDAGTTVYFLPYTATAGWNIEAIELNGVWAGCLRDLQVAVNAPARVLPIELLVSEQSPPGRDQRITWAEIWSEFWQWKREATYP